MFKRYLPIALVVAYPLLVHASVVLAMPYLQVIAVLLFLLGILVNALLRWQLLPWLVFLGLSSIIVALGYYSLALYLLYIPPILIPLGLSILFGSTLLPGRTPLITAIATKARGPLSPGLLKYTAFLTQLWCGLFLILVMWSVVLTLIGQPEMWSWFTNFINYGIVGVLFTGEFFVRKKLFPEHNHPGFFEYIHIIIQSNIRR